MGLGWLAVSPQIVNQKQMRSLVGDKVRGAGSLVVNESRRFCCEYGPCAFVTLATEGF